MAANIRKEGFAVLKIIDAPVAYIYSVGLTETFAVPEFIFVGSLSDYALGLICKCVADLASTAPDKLREKTSVIEDALVIAQPDGGAKRFPIGWKPVNKARVLGSAEPSMAQVYARYGNAFEARQLFISDENGKLPWDPECEKKIVALGSLDLSM